ncbi:MAG: antitoxin [Chitinivibrionales bacterium]|nr:antitoxin [Chitinivibrionales bacterium]MBD3356336.1 antitoxin [Chitinivibrionales bacterium]
MPTKLRKEENDLLKAYERGEWRSKKKVAQRKEQIREFARNTMKKDKRVNIRISERDLKEIQRKAVHEGLPYQTLISSVLHKFINGNLIQRPSH